MDTMPNAACFTGHRPAKFPFDTKDPLKLKMFLSTVYMLTLEAYHDLGITTFYTGMQTGMDIWAGEQVVRLRDKYPEVRLIGVSPYAGEANRRSFRDAEEYFRLKRNCNEFVTLSKTYNKNVFFARNRFMVDASKYVIAAMSPAQPSGTLMTVKYAISRGRRVHVIDLDRFAAELGFNSPRRTGEALPQNYALFEAVLDDSGEIVRRPIKV